MVKLTEVKWRVDRSLFFSAMRETLREGYTWRHFFKDLIAGVTVGVIAIPLAMALAIASGVPPQYGLYTAVVAGFVIALLGGSRLNISGPTAAFVVLLLPVTQTYGLGGLSLCTFMAGIILVVLAVSGLGGLVRYVPYSVTIGFTAGIGVVIFGLQLPDFLGLKLMFSSLHFHEKMGQVFSSIFHSSFSHLNWIETSIGAVTLLSFIGWLKLKIPIPAHLVSLFVGTVFSLLLQNLFPTAEIATIATRFHYEMHGIAGVGIPPFLPEWVWPWELPDLKGQPIGFSFTTITQLLPHALSIAALGAIESLLCAVVADGMSGKKHHSNGELWGQGIGNVIAACLGGIVATAAIARTSANIRAGAISPVAAIIHAWVVLLAIILLSPFLSYLPMSALAALLMMVAYNMADFKHVFYLLRVAPQSDRWILVVCFSITVLFDMVLAVSVGLILASLFFIKKMSELTEVIPTSHHSLLHQEVLPDDVCVYDINGPLFFGTAEVALENIRLVNPKLKIIILDLQDVAHIDMTGLAALQSFLHQSAKRSVEVILLSPLPSVVKAMVKAGLLNQVGVHFAKDVSCAVTIVNQYGAFDSR